MFFFLGGFTSKTSHLTWHPHLERNKVTFCFDGLIAALSCYDIWNQEIIVKTADDPNGRVVLGPNEPIFLRRTVGMLFVFFFFWGNFQGTVRWGNFPLQKTNQQKPAPVEVGILFFWGPISPQTNWFHWIFPKQKTTKPTNKNNLQCKDLWCLYLRRLIGLGWPDSAAWRECKVWVGAAG